MHRMHQPVPHPLTIKAIRERAGLTQTQMATALGLTQGQVSRIENGDQTGQMVPGASWVQAGPRIALGQREDRDVRPVWLLNSADPDDPRYVRPLLDERDQVGVYLDGDLAHRAALALSLLGLIPNPAALPYWPREAADVITEATGDEAPFYAVDDPEMSADPIDRAAAIVRSNEYVLSCMRRVLHELHRQREGIEA